MDIIKMAVVGSTKFGSSGAAYDWAEKEIEKFILVMPANLVISGGAVGVDSIAHIVADKLGIEFKEFLPENHRWAPNGFKARNILIAEACTHLVCIRHSESTTYGSGWTADYAEKLGKPVLRKVY